MKTLFHPMCIIAISLLVSSFTYARTDLGVRALSFGGAYRAVATGNDIIYYNPAGLIKNRRIGIDADYILSQESRFHNVGISFIDSSTTSWGMGLAYNVGFQPKSDHRTTHLAYLALAMPIVTDMFSLGAAFSYNYDANCNGDLNRHFFNMDVGMMATLPMGLSFAVVADHLFKPKGLEKPMGLSVASAFDFGVPLKSVPLTLSFDWLMDHVTSKQNLDHVIAIGAEYILFTVLPLRLGFKSELKENHQFMSLGTGVIIKNFALDALYQQNLTVGQIRSFGLGVRLAL